MVWFYSLSCFALLTCSPQSMNESRSQNSFSHWLYVRRGLLYVVRRKEALLGTLSLLFLSLPVS